MSSPSFAPILKDRRLWAVAAVSALSAFVGFRLFSAATALSIVTYAGYWSVLAVFVIFICSLVRVFGTDLAAVVRKGLGAVDWASLGVIGIGGTILLVHESFGFKIVMDELMLAGTSMCMHFERTVLTPVRGADLHGTFVILAGILDKRPLFFPFLESLVHDLTGYRPENAFILNGILTFVFLALVNATGRMLAGRMAGWIGVALCAGLPLLGQNATSGGFELLNLVMILATMLLGARYIARPGNDTFTAFVFSALLMAQVRYESPIFLAPVAAIILWVWWRQGRADTPWVLFAAPVLMIHCALHNRIFQAGSSAWQLQSKPGYSEPFSLLYIPDNVAHAIGFFFNLHSEDQPNSLALSVLGSIAIVFFLLLVLKRVRYLPAETPVSVATIFFTIGFACQLALLMCYFWGRFDDVVIRRLSLPTCLWMVVAVMAVLQEFPKKAVGCSLFGIAVLAAVVQGVPSMAAHAYSQEYLVGRETAWRRQFIADHPKKDYLVIDNDSILWIAHRVAATPVSASIQRRDALSFFLKNRAFSDIYVFQHFQIDPDTGKKTLRPDDDVGPNYVLEPVAEQSMQLLTLTRISRIREVRDGSKDLSAPGPDRVVPKSAEEQDKERRAYFENFLKRLP